MRKVVECQDGVDAFIAHTSMEKRWLSSEGVKPYKIHIVRYPCVPDELFEYEPRADIYDKLGAETVIAYVSRMHPRKGQHLLLQAASYLKHWLKDFKVYVAGPVADGRYLKTLRELVEKHGLRERVAMDPRPLPEREKLDAMSTSDIFACTPVKEYTPVIALEALALGTPVAATEVGAIPELLGAGKPVALAKPEPAEVGKAVMRVLESGLEAGPNEPAKVASAHRASW